MEPASQPLVTIVIPAHNVGRFIGRAVGSVIGQTVADWECIIVDDGSEDDTGERLHQIEDPRLRIIRQDKKGVSVARNRGLAAAAGRYVLFLDGDDYLHPLALERLSTALMRHPEAVLSYGTFVKVLEDESPQPNQRPLDRYRFPSGDVLRRVIEENFIMMGTALLDRVAAVRAGGFNPAISLSEDWEFWCRMAAAGHFIFIGNEPEVACIRLRRQSSSRVLAREWQHFTPSIEAVLNNPTLRARFPAAEWRAIERRVSASHLWEFGRVSFCSRQYWRAYRYMARSLLTSFHLKRAVMFALAMPSQAFNVSIVPRLRFNDHDQ